MKVPLVGSGHGHVGLDGRSFTQWAAVRRTFGLMNWAVQSSVSLGYFWVGLGIFSMPTHLNGATVGLPLKYSGGVRAFPTWASRVFVRAEGNPGGRPKLPSRCR